MTASSNPGPDERDPLSSWELRVLAGIEDDLVASDPRLAHDLSRPGRPGRRWWPLSARSAGLLFVALLVLVLAGVLVPASGWAVLALITALVVVPWILLCAVERRGSD